MPLTETERVRLAAIMDTITINKAGRSDYAIPRETVEWLAVKLGQLNREVRRFKDADKNRTRNEAETLYRNRDT